YGRKDATWAEVGGGAYTKAEADAKFVDVAGDTMTGALTIASASYPVFTLSKPVGAFANYISGAVGGIARWQMLLGDATTESGGNAGSDFQLLRIGDAADFLGAPLFIRRSTGDVTIGTTTASTSPTTGALTVAGGAGISGALQVGGAANGNRLIVGTAVTVTAVGAVKV